MNASSWRKAVDLVAQGTQANQQVWAAAMAESSQLESLPLSVLSADDSGPPQVTYGTEQPLTASTPRATLTSIPETQTTDTYHQIIPGMSDHLYPTLVADGSLSTPIADICSTLQNQITSEIDKYLQEVAERCERDDNYFDGQHMATNTSSQQQEANFIEQDEEDDEVRVLESNGQDTGEHGINPTEHDIQYQDKLETIPEDEEEEDPQMAEKQDYMSPDSKFILLIMHVTKLENDLCNFPATWAVLSILLDTQSNELQYVKTLQQVVDNYYDRCTTEVMSRLEHQIIDIMNAMYDSVTNDNFASISDDTDRVSGAIDNDYDKNDNGQMPYDNDNDQMPCDNDNDQMPYNNDNDQMSYDNDNDNDTATGEMKYDRNMTNELKDVGTKDMVPYKRDDNSTTKVKWSIETSDVGNDFMREYDNMCKSMEDRQINDFYEARRHIQSAIWVIPQQRQGKINNVLIMYLIMIESTREYLSQCATD